MARTTDVKGRRAARRRLDERGGELRERQSQFSVPHAGWIRSIREALGMSARELGARMGVHESNVVRLEASERSERARLNSLRRAADALDCDLVYALVPRQPLERMVQDRARRQAEKALTGVQHTMLLEDQAPLPSSLGQLIEDDAAERIDRPGLWDG